MPILVSRKTYVIEVISLHRVFEGITRIPTCLFSYLSSSSP